MPDVLGLVVKHWFLLGLVAVILFAKVAPSIGKNGGILYPEVTVKYGAVSLIFFNSGLTLRTEDLKAAVMQLRLHTLIQGFTLAFVPVAMVVLVNVLRSVSSLSSALLTGLLVLSCMPPPVSSAVILTNAAGGNEAAAIFNSAFGSFLGIFVTPLLLFALVGESAGVPLEKIFFSLTMTVVVPLLVGQLVRFRAWTAIEKLRIPFSQISSAVLLLIIYTTFCETFSGNVAVDSSELLTIVVLIVMIQAVEIVMVFLISNRFNFAPADTVCAVFCATHKSLTLGIPMLNIVFAGHAQLSLVSVPLLVYHPTQILLGGFLVPIISKWMLTAESRKQATLPVRG